MRRRTGVVLGIHRDTDSDTAARICTMLEERFPGVAFAVVPSAASLSFEFDDPLENPDEPVQRR